MEYTKLVTSSSLLIGMGVLVLVLVGRQAANRSNQAFDAATTADSASHATDSSSLSILSEKDTATVKNPIPPLDARVPETLETATFAMG